MLPTHTHSLFTLVPRARHMRRNPTPSEAILWDALRDRRRCGIKFRRQHPIGPFIVDFFAFSHRLVVEVDGGIHSSQRIDDARRDQCLARVFQCRVVRVEASDVEGQLQHVLGVIRAALIA